MKYSIRKKTTMLEAARSRPRWAVGSQLRRWCTCEGAPGAERGLRRHLAAGTVSGVGVGSAGACRAAWRAAWRVAAPDVAAAAPAAPKLNTWQSSKSPTRLTNPAAAVAIIGMRGAWHAKKNLHGRHARIAKHACSHERHSSIDEVDHPEWVCLLDGIQRETGCIP